MIVIAKFNDNLRKGGEWMKGKLSKVAAKGTKTVLNTVLRADANSTTCIFTYQPKAPKELAKFRRMK